MQKIKFNYADGSFTFNKKGDLKTFVEKLFQIEGKELESINYIFCSDNYLIEINRFYLNHDDYTDIITFDLSESKQSPTIGEIYISTERVKENANKFNVPIAQEMLRVVFHGALHLCGYKDKFPKDVKIMRAKEQKYLTLFSKRCSPWNLRST